MASTEEIDLGESPDEFTKTESRIERLQWDEALEHWTQKQLKEGSNNVAKDAQTTLETVLICTTMEQCEGHRYLTAKRLGYGRNAFTRKIKELQLEF